MRYNWNMTNGEWNLHKRAQIDPELRTWMIRNNRVYSVFDYAIQAATYEAMRQAMAIAGGDHVQFMFEYARWMKNHHDTDKLENFDSQWKFLVQFCRKLNSELKHLALESGTVPAEPIDPEELLKQGKTKLIPDRHGGLPTHDAVKLRPSCIWVVHLDNGATMYGDEYKMNDALDSIKSSVYGRWIEFKKGARVKAVGLGRKRPVKKDGKDIGWLVDLVGEYEDQKVKIGIAYVRWSATYMERISEDEIREVVDRDSHNNGEDNGANKNSGLRKIKDTLMSGWRWIGEKI